MKTTVVLVGWLPGLRTIALMDLIRTMCGPGLAKAKAEVEALVDRQPQSFTFASAEAAEEFRRQAIALGAVAE
jgi:hypothetical protein